MEEAKTEWGPFFGAGQPSWLEGVLSFAVEWNSELWPSCNTGPPYQTFALARQSQGTCTLSGHICCSVSDVTWLKQPPLGPVRRRPSPAEAHLGKSSRCGSWRWRKPSAVDLTRSPACWRQGQPKQTRQKAQAVRFQKTPVKVVRPHTYGWKDTQLTKSSFLCNLLFLVSPDPLWTGERQWVQLRKSGRG